MKIWEDGISKATDSIYGVLISHLYTEHLIDRYLLKKLPHEGGLTGKNGLSYSNKLKLVKSFGDIDNQIVDALSKLNDIRNDCAHIFGHEMSKENVEKYGRTLGRDYQRIISGYHDAATHGLATITWHGCGKLLAIVA